MEPMSWVAWIFAGIIAGWIAEHLTGRRHGLITNLVVGLLGSFVGGWLAKTLDYHPFDNVFLNNLALATGGAVILLFIFGLVRRRG